MKTQLELVYLDSALREFIVRVDDPRADLSETEIEQAMQEILAQNVFVSNYGQVESIKEANIVTTQTTSYSFAE